jgi:cytochrome P450 family 6
MGVIIYLVLATVALAYLWIQKRYRYWTERGFLSPRNDIPFGSFKGVAQTITWFEAMDNIYKEFKGKAAAVGFFVFVDPNIMPIDPEVFKNILVRDFSSFHDRGFYYNKKDDPISAQ